MKKTDDPQLSSSLAQSFGQVLIKSARLYNESAIAQLKEHVSGIRTAHTLLFPYVPLQGIRLTVLAKKVGVSKQAVAQLVDELVQMGAFVKVPDPSDGRARLIRWSDAEQIHSGLAALERVQGPLVEALGAERMARLRGDLTDVLRVLEGL